MSHYCVQKAAAEWPYNIPLFMPQPQLTDEDRVQRWDIKHQEQLSQHDYRATGPAHILPGNMNGSIEINQISLPKICTGAGSFSHFCTLVTMMRFSGFHQNILCHLTSLYDTIWLFLSMQFKQKVPLFQHLSLQEQTSGLECICCHVTSVTSCYFKTAQLLKSLEFILLN